MSHERETVSYRLLKLARPILDKEREGGISGKLFSLSQRPYICLIAVFDYILIRLGQACTAACTNPLSGMHAVIFGVSISW